jgi:hypothetical protein
MTDDTVICLSERLRDGREIKSEEDMQQWLYEYFDRISCDFGRSMVPSEVFPPMVRVMIEWVEVHQGLPDKDLNRENAQALADSISKLSECLRHLLRTLDRS